MLRTPDPVPFAGTDSVSLHVCLRVQPRCDAEWVAVVCAMCSVTFWVTVLCGVFPAVLYV